MDPYIKDAQTFAQEVKGRNPIRASLLLLAIVAFMGIAAFWAALTEIDTVTRTDGRVVPSGEVQIVQPGEPGVITDIHVSDGDLVVAGDPLVTLDATQVAGELARLQMRAQALQLRIARLSAEVAQEDFVLTPAIGQLPPARFAAERALYLARKTALGQEIGVLQLQIDQRRNEVREAETRVATAETVLGLVEEEVNLIAPLVDANVEPRTRLIALQGRRTDAFGRLSEAKSAVLRAELALAELDDRITSTLSAFIAAAVEGRVTAEAELAELEAVLPSIETRLSRAVLVAPVRGIVNRVLATTRGSLARGGEPLVEIVPIEDDLLVEAYLTPADVAFVRAGQDVRINITAYDPSRYGGIDGRILRVGADAVTRPDRDEQVFIVEIATLTRLTDAAGEAVEILPGMVAQVDILSGKRTVLDYLIAPVVRVKETAFRE